ncbi:hypothetical protein LC612_29495 [Nostoc sp. CHAB 5834]|nr:hypothetical protein [Nostoc sp. CHAB 5834]
MPYPTIQRSDARSYIASCKNNSSAELPPRQIKVEGDEHDWESIANDLFATLDQFAIGEPVKKRGDARGSAFEIMCGPIIHRELPSDIALADPTFWTWLTVTYGKRMVEWRYENNPDVANYGAGSPAENLFFRIWLRAEVAHSAELADPYSLASVGDIDFWRSHIFRQTYADARTFAKALINFQFPIENERKARLTIGEIRALAKRLKRARTNLLFELMDAKRATAFIEQEWERLAEPT